MCLLQHIQTTKTAPKSIPYIQLQSAVLMYMLAALKKYTKISKTVISKQFGNNNIGSVKAPYLFKLSISLISHLFD